MLVCNVIRRWMAAQGIPFCRQNRPVVAREGRRLVDPLISTAHMVMKQPLPRPPA